MLPQLLRRLTGQARSIQQFHHVRSFAVGPPLVRSSFARLEDEDLNQFKRMLGPEGVLTDETAIAAHNRDWMHKYQGHSSLVLRPASTKQVSSVLKYCNDRGLAVVPQGGNTGLVGGSVPVFDEVILSTSRMSKVLSFDPSSGALVAQAGCVLQALDDVVEPQGWTMPLDLGAKGSCHIGGNVSTNAGGLRLLRYGSLHGSVLGLEVVLANGQVLDLCRTLRKDNTGYDLKQLFIGAEGTLGVVTAVAIQCAPRPASVQVVFLALPSYHAVTTVLSKARSMLGEVLSAFEFLDAESMRYATTYLPGVSNPLQGNTGSASGEGSSTPGGDSSSTAPFYVLLETHGSSEEHDTAKLNTFLEAVMGDGSVVDGTVASSISQAAAIWRVREGISEALTKRGAVYKYDVSLPVPDMYRLVEDMRSRLSRFRESVRVIGYGHVGDGNLHLNISAPEYSPELESAIEPYVYEWTARARGSISAEHGLGRMKAACIGYSKPPEAVGLMQSIKSMLDPKGILNPYKVLPPAGSTHATGSAESKGTAVQWQPGSYTSHVR